MPVCGESHDATIPPATPAGVPGAAISRWRSCLHLLVHPGSIRTSESYPLPPPLNRSIQLIRVGAVVLATAGLLSCSANKADAPPPTIVPAQAAESPPATGAPVGV